MIKSRTALGLILAASITIPAAMLHGRWTNRWAPPDALLKAAVVFQALPREFGPWHRVESQTLTPAVRGILQCDNYVQDVYENRETREQVLLTLLLGPPGPMAVHTPEICYASIDHELLAERQRIELEPKGSDNSIWMVQFHNAHDLQGRISRIYYAWSDGTKWIADAQPRVTFGGHPFLFKVQLLVRLPDEASAQSQDSARALLKEFVPAFAQAAAALHSADAN